MLLALLQERDPPEGPIPHLESRLCVLLTIVPLAIANVLAEEAKMQFSSLQGAETSGFMETEGGHGMGEKSLACRKEALISSLQVLGNFTGLLCPPASVTGEANNAAAKAASFISKNAKDGLGSGGPRETFKNSGNLEVCIFFTLTAYYILVLMLHLSYLFLFLSLPKFLFKILCLMKYFGMHLCSLGGNMRHLIVEACIARNLIDTSAYYWPGYVSASAVTLSDLSPIQKSPWSMFMEGAPLNGSLVNLLLTTPASRYDEQFLV